MIFAQPEFNLITLDHLRMPLQDADTVIYISVCVLTLWLLVGLLKFTANSACPVFSMFLTNQTAIVTCLCFLLFISASLPLFAVETDSHMAVITAAWMTDQGEYRVALLTLYSVKSRTTDKVAQEQNVNPLALIQNLVTGFLYSLHVFPRLS